ncbi:MAG: DnaD domain protein [Spiroplasma sp.]|nr:DnaD domain protein [Spiroplasma sp.]
MQRIINETDTFQVILKENIDHADYQYLFMLYQPIIGVNAINLYLTLVQEKNLTNRINLEFNHKRLMLLLNLNEIELLEAFQKLEVYKLLISYYYQLKSTYIYQLQKPIMPKHFFANPEFENNLINKLGSLQFERQKYYFLKSQPEVTEDFTNISHSIDEKISPSRVNLQQLINKLNQTKSEIIIKQSRVKTKPHQLRANSQVATQNLNINSKNILNEMLNLMQEKNPEEYLTHLTKKPIDNKLKNTLKQLSLTYHLNNEVINCLIEYAWFKNDKRIEPNYIFKIAQTFQENKIDNINDAWKHLKLAYLKSKKNSFSYGKTYHQDVLWTNDQIDFDFNNETINDNQTKNDQKNLMTEKEITKILEEFDKH